MITLPAAILRPLDWIRYNFWVFWWSCAAMAVLVILPLCLWVNALEQPYFHLEAQNREKVSPIVGAFGPFGYASSAVDPQIQLGRLQETRDSMAALGLDGSASWLQGIDNEQYLETAGGEEYMVSNFTRLLWQRLCDSIDRLSTMSADGPSDSALIAVHQEIRRDLEQLSVQHVSEVWVSAMTESEWIKLPEAYAIRKAAWLRWQFIPALSAAFAIPLLAFLFLEDRFCHWVNDQSLAYWRKTNRDR